LRQKTSQKKLRISIPRSKGGKTEENRGTGGTWADLCFSIGRKGPKFILDGHAVREELKTKEDDTRPGKKRSTQERGEKERDRPTMGFFPAF